MTPGDYSSLPSPWREVLQQIDTGYAEAHKRLRADLTAAEQKIESNFNHFQDMALANRARIENLATTPIDATKLMLTTRAILTLVFGVVAVVASYWNLSSKLDAQQRSMEGAARLQEVQMKVLGDAAADAKATAADAKRQYELLRYEFQSLKEAMQKKGT